MEWDYYTEEYSIDPDLVKIVKAPPMYADLDMDSEDEDKDGDSPGESPSLMVPDKRSRSF